MLAAGRATRDRYGAQHPMRRAQQAFLMAVDRKILKGFVLGHHQHAAADYEARGSICTLPKAPLPRRGPSCTSLKGSSITGPASCTGIAPRVLALQGVKGSFLAGTGGSGIGGTCRVHHEARRMWQAGVKGICQGDHQGRRMWQGSLIGPSGRNGGVRHQQLVRLHDDKPQILVFLA